MIGTIVNTCTIIAGTVLGAMLHRGIKEKYKTVLYNGLGLVSLAIGLNATIQNFPKSQYPVLFIVAMALGGVVGTWLDIDGRFKKLVNRPLLTSPRRGGKDDAEKVENSSNCKEETNDLETTKGSLADGLATAILLYCIGPLSMLGPVVSALQGDHTFLFTNATLDFVSATIFASTYGLGMVFAAPVLFCWQGLFFLVATISSSAVSDALMAELLIVGGLLITASGLSLLQLKDCKTLNLLPALLVPVLFFVIVELIFRS